jgi:hypothetical protein
VEKEKKEIVFYYLIVVKIEEESNIDKGRRKLIENIISAVT